MKFRIEADGEAYLLDLRRDGATSEYKLEGALRSSGTASVIEVMPGVFSVLAGHRSFAVHVTVNRSEGNGDELEIWSGTQRLRASIADVRDRSGKSKKPSASGPMEVRAQMPGKVIELMVKLGDTVAAGQGVAVVEAMKMQNELKSPKDGMISRIYVAEGAAVGAGQALVVIE